MRTYAYRPRGRWALPLQNLAEQSELDELGQATLGSPQLSVDEQRCQLGGDDVGNEEPQQEVLLSSRESVQTAPARMERSESGFGSEPG